MTLRLSARLLHSIMGAMENLISNILLLLTFFADSPSNHYRGVGAATYMDARRLSELYCGFQRQRGRGPTLYPVACSPQAWASATPFALPEAALGLEFDPGKGEMHNPRLPSFLDEVTLRNLRLGSSSVDLKVRRPIRTRFRSISCAHAVGSKSPLSVRRVKVARPYITTETHYRYRHGTPMPVTAW
jgi:hypothetical protein